MDEAGVIEGLEPVSGEQQSIETTSQQAQQTDPRAAEKSYRDWIKAAKIDDPNFKRVKDDYGRLQEISRIDQKGVDGVKSTYQALQGIAYGEKTGLEAVSDMQAKLADSETLLDAIADGQIESLPEESRDGILRMLPSMLDHLASTDDAAYTKALLPHFVDALKSSPLLTSFNAMVDVLEAQPPKYLTEDQKVQWQAEKFQGIIKHASTMGQWFNQQQARVKEMGGESKDGRNLERTDKGERRGANEPAAGSRWWQDNVNGEIDRHAETTFTTELRQWTDRLAKAGFRLSDAKKTALAAEFTQGIVAKAKANPSYSSQMKRYNGQRTPDASSIKALARTEFNRHASQMMRSLIERDYGQVLNKKMQAKPNGQGERGNIAPQKGVRVVSIMPKREEINFPGTPADWLMSDKYRMRDGSVIQYRP